ncbi:MULTISPECIES: DUF2905 domain-containing protein [unclassified Marinitoga]|uniref:DUF2905 domain-containing protein n=1 Tax=unclassified Marinitoga TaxID=2640159 RepID=UPI00064161EA|nr:MULTISPECIES: DUF2905 domain-containing protein [unclassified Marinitoga]KLO24535.1 hypothetical protein X274_03350 [Marinitoga sp. 1155]NUU99414.1 membrane protein [Marinitoga sp. 1154]
MQNIGKLLISSGILMIFLGFIFYFSNKIPFKFGHLPGDIIIKKEGFIFYFPITSAILISIILNFLYLIIKIFIK